MYMTHKHTIFMEYVLYVYYNFISFGSVGFLYITYCLYKDTVVLLHHWSNKTRNVLFRYSLTHVNISITTH